MKEKLLQINRWMGNHVLIMALLWLVLPAVFSSMDYVMHILIMVAIYVMLAEGLNLVMGYGGQLQIGFAAFFGIGAYISGLLLVRTGWSFWPTLPLAFGGSFLIGGFIGLPSIRVRGDYLGIVTLGFGEITRILLTNWDTLTNGPMGISGIPSPTLLGLNFGNKTLFFYMVTIFAAVCFFVMRRLVNSKFGFKLIAVSHDESVAEVLGIRTGAVKIMAYAISAGIAGFAGAVYASYFLFISPDSFIFNDSLAMLCMVVVGGRGNIIGTAIGAVILTLAPEVFRFLGDYRMLMYGVALTAMVIFKPMGLFGMDKRKRNVIVETCEKKGLLEMLKKGVGI